MSTSLGARGSSSEARDDSEVEEEEGRGLSEGEMLAEEAGVESVVGSRRRGASCSRAVVDIAGMMERLREYVCRQRQNKVFED